jgi:hydrogenase maturation factor
MGETENDRTLGLGKVSREVLERSVFSHLPLAAKPQLDAGAISCGGELILAHSPSIGVPLESLGFFGFHYAAANVAARFAWPKHLVTGFYLPLGSKERELRTIASSLGAEARRYGVTIAAGQTATYAGIETPLVTATCMGERVRDPADLSSGDDVYVVGEVGGEAIWLKELSVGVESDGWRAFTPLPAMLRMHQIGDVKLMHDVSEGGLKKALQEVSEALNVRLDVETHGLCFADGVRALGEDPLRIPTYGTAVVIVESGEGGEVEKACEELGVPCSPVGVVESGAGLIVDGLEVGRLERVDLDKLYGSFKDTA